MAKQTKTKQNANSKQKDWESSSSSRVQVQDLELVFTIGQDNLYVAWMLQVEMATIELVKPFEDFPTLSALKFCFIDYTKPYSLSCRKDLSTNVKPNIPTSQTSLPSGVQ
jgi:hypothetical protein